MIGGKELMILQDFSTRDKNDRLVLDLSIATPNVIKLAKKLHWPPFDNVDGKTYICY